MKTTLAIIFALSFLGIALIIWRNRKAILAFNAAEDLRKRRKELKDRLLIARMRRLIDGPRAALHRVVHDGWKHIRRQFWGTVFTLRAKEQAYAEHEHAREGTSATTATVAERLLELMSDAKRYSDEERYDDAERKYIGAIALDPKYIPAYEGLGELYYDRKNFEQARETFAHIVKMNERNAEAHARLGAIATATGNFEEAETDYERALTMAGDLVTAHIDLGEVHRAMEKYPEALENYARARALEPKNPRVLDGYIELAILLGKKAAAHEVLNELAEVNPDNQKLEEFRERIVALPKERVRKPRTAKG